MRPLHLISSDLMALGAALTDLDGEIPDGAVGEALENWFNGLTEERDAKVGNYCALITHLEAEADYAEAESKRIAAIAKAHRNAVDRLKGRLKFFFEQHDIKKLDLGVFKPRVQANGGALPLIVPEEWRVFPENAPERFHKIKIELNTDEIRDAIRNDEAPEGCAIGERGTHLRIR